MFITNYLRLNQNLVKNSYPLSILGETMQKLECFQYDLALYLNMGYYTIRLTRASQDMMPVVNKLGKFKYNHLPMSMCASGDIFQAKFDELLGDIKGVKTYINDILVLGEG